MAPRGSGAARRGTNTTASATASAATASASTPAKPVVAEPEEQPEHRPEERKSDDSREEEEDEDEEEEEEKGDPDPDSSDDDDDLPKKKKAAQASPKPPKKEKPGTTKLDWYRGALEFPDRQLLRGEENFESWHDQVLQELEVLGWEPGCVLDNRDDRRLSIMLRRTMREEPTIHIQGIKSGMEVLDILQAAYYGTGIVAQEVLSDELNDLRLDEDKTVADYTATFNSLAVKLAEAGTPRYKSELKTMYIRGARDRYPEWATRWRGQLRTQNVDLKIIQADLRDEARYDEKAKSKSPKDGRKKTMNSQNNSSNNSIDNFTNKGPRRRKDGSIIRDGNCRHCGKPGHWERECRSKAAGDDAKSEQSDKAGKSGKTVGFTTGTEYYDGGVYSMTADRGTTNFFEKWWAANKPKAEEDVPKNTEFYVEAHEKHYDGSQSQGKSQGKPQKKRQDKVNHIAESVEDDPRTFTTAGEGIKASRFMESGMAFAAVHSAGPCETTVDDGDQRQPAERVDHPSTGHQRQRQRRKKRQRRQWQQRQQRQHPMVATNVSEKEEQNSRNWQVRFCKEMAALGLIPLVSDNAIYINTTNGTIVVNYVDDLFIIAGTDELIDDLANGLERRGVEVQWQAKDSDPEALKQRYRQRAGQIIHLTTRTKPDTASTRAHSIANPTEDQDRKENVTDGLTKPPELEHCAELLGMEAIEVLGQA